MDNNDSTNKQVIEKNPVGAAVLSALFPGTGFFYIGNYIKGISYVLVFAALIVLETRGRGPENIVFGLMIAGFYIFQIFDSFNEAKRTRYAEPGEATREDEPDSLFASILLVVVGLFFQLAELDILSYNALARLWPLVLIALGAKFIYTYNVSNREDKNDDKSDQYQPRYHQTEDQQLEDKQAGGNHE